MHNVTKIKLKILNQGKNTDDEISLGAFADFRLSYMTTSVAWWSDHWVLLFVKKLKHME